MRLLPVSLSARREPGPPTLTVTRVAAARGLPSHPASGHRDRAVTRIGTCVTRLGRSAESFNFRVNSAPTRSPTGSPAWPARAGPRPGSESAPASTTTTSPSVTGVEGRGGSGPDPAPAARLHWLPEQIPFFFPPLLA